MNFAGVSIPFWDSMTYNENMPPKKKAAKIEQIVIRFESRMREALEKEAEIDGRPLAAYLRHLISTDPRRKKK